MGRFGGGICHSQRRQVVSGVVLVYLPPDPPGLEVRWSE